MFFLLKKHHTITFINKGVTMFITCHTVTPNN